MVFPTRRFIRGRRSVNLSRRRPTYRRRTAMRSARPQRSLALTRYRRANVHAFKRHCLKGSNIATSTTSGGVNIAYTFSLNDLPNSGEFTALYDQYKITGIKLDIIWRSTNLSMVETQNTQQIGAPYMYWCIDRDDSTSTSITDLREYSKAKRFEFDVGRRTCKIYFKPNTLAENYLTAITTGYTVSFDRWIDAAYPTMPYWGFKAAIQVPLNSVTGVAAYFDIEATYYFKMKDPR